MSCKLDNLEGAKRLIIFNSIKNNCSILFVGGVGLTLFLLPILMILLVAKEINFGSVVVCLIAWFISGYFIRLYLWNKYGEEVFIMSKNTLETYDNYGLFKDNHKVYNFKEVNIFFILGGDIVYINRLDKKYFENSKQLSKIGFQLDEEIVTSHKELSISKIIEITEYIKTN